MEVRDENWVKRLNTPVNPVDIVLLCPSIHSIAVVGGLAYSRIEFASPALEAGNFSGVLSDANVEVIKELYSMY